MRDDQDQQTPDLLYKGMRIGYVRVSKQEQNQELQLDALEKAGCQTIYQDKTSGVKDLPEQQQAIKALRPGDTLVVWSIDRLGRKTVDLIKLIEYLNENNIGFISTTQQIDTTTPIGKVIYILFSALAENERSQLIERTHAGLASARKRGRIGGRKPAFGKKEIREIEALLLDPEITVTDVAARYNVARSTIYKYIDMQTINEKRIKKIMEDKDYGKTITQ